MSANIDLYCQTMTCLKFLVDATVAISGTFSNNSIKAQNEDNEFKSNASSQALIEPVKNDQIDAIRIDRTKKRKLRGYTA